MGSEMCIRDRHREKKEEIPDKSEMAVTEEEDGKSEHKGFAPPP